LFFVISGFIIVYVSESLFGRAGAPRSFFLRRCARIIPLYWATSAALLVYALMAYPNLQAANMSPETIAASFMFFPYPRADGSLMPIHAVGWTLNYEMFFYAVFAVALLASRQIAVIGVSVFFMALVVLGRWTALPPALAFWTDPIILEFVFGAWIALIYRSGWRLPRWATNCLLIAGVAMIAGGIVWGFEQLPRVIERGVPAAFIVAAVALSRIPQSTAFGWRAMGLIGDASYALYLTHPVAVVLPRLLFPGLVDPAVHPWLYVLLLFPCAILFAIAAHLVFEKPVTRFLQRRIAIRGARVAAASRDALVSGPSVV